MFEHEILQTLLRGYIDGDRVSLRVLLDHLEEAGDDRVDSLREETIDWDDLADQLVRMSVSRHRHSESTRNYYRFLIDCVRMGSDSLPIVVEAVREARWKLVRSLFPDVEW